MQISKFLLTVCAVTVCAGFTCARAQDNPAQAAARAALMEKMDTLNGAQTQPPPAVAPEPAPTAPVDMQPAATIPAASSPAPADDEAQAKARAALLEQMQATGQSPPAAPNPSAAPAPAVVPPMMPMTNAVAVQPPPKPVQSKPAPPAVGKQAGSEPGFAPIVAPPLPISMTKEEQLQALNAKYMANEISPQEYFKQREAIVNGP